MKVATPTQQIPTRSDPLGTNYKPQSTQFMSARMEPAVRSSAISTQSMPHHDPFQQERNPTAQPSMEHINLPQTPYSTERGQDTATDTLSLDPFRHRRPQRKAPGPPVDTGPSRAPPPPPTESKADTPTNAPPQETSLKDVQVEHIEQTPWHAYEIPKELEILLPNVPDEIRGIIQESLDEQRTIRLSRLQAPAIVVGTSVNTGHRIQSYDAEAVVAESSAMASNRPAGSTPSSVRTDSLDLSLNSTTSLGSSSVGNDTVSPRGGRGSEDSQRFDLRASAGKLQKSREKLSKAHGLFKMLRRPRDALIAAGVEPEPETYECTSCFDDIPNKEAIGLPCRHRYCTACFSQLIATALQNEDHFPPKCCLQEIPRGVLRKHLGTKELASYDDKALEYAVAIGSRYYCARPECAKWIDTRKARSQNGALRCPHCSHSMCTICRGPVHPGDQDCPQDFGLNSTLEQAEKAGWRRCYNCRALVELNTGCRHITCKCRAEFCYTCGARWKTCACTEEDQARRAQQIRENLEKLEAEAQAEEEELRAAIAAVEEAERQAAEARREEELREEEARAEEARQITMREFKRVEHIVQHYDRLRDILEKVRMAQEEALRRRHEFEMDEVAKMGDPLVDAGAERNSSDKQEMANIVSARDGKIQEVRKQHAAALIATRARHRQDEDAFLIKITESDSYHSDSDPSIMLEMLLSSQEFERSTLRSLQMREIEKYRRRCMIHLRVLEEKMAEKEERRKEEWGMLEEEVRRVKRGQWAEWKWVEVLREERLKILGQDERGILDGGGEIEVETEVDDGKETGEGRETGKEKEQEKGGVGGKEKEKERFEDWGRIPGAYGLDDKGI
ncbi:MAG: hypothetical protein Q9182_002349 [Xanthomendoza sp. 2 TL-2023]